MSTENIEKFYALVAEDSALADRIRLINEEAVGTTAQKIAALSTESGLPISPKDVLARTEEITDEQLEAVSGGVWDVTGGNICLSIFTLGLGCLGRAIESALGHRGGEHGVDACQGQKKT